MARVLIVDDEPSMRVALKSLLESNGHETVEASSGIEALGHLDGIDAVITDYSMQRMNGVQLLEAIHERDQSLPVLLLTAHGSERLAVQAMKAGACDYLTKPPDNDELSLVIDKALEARALRIQNRRPTAAKTVGHSVIGSSKAMRQLLDDVARIGPKDITVLVRGETGTGKELIASLIHAHSRRSSVPLVRFNCAAIPGELAEADLFLKQMGERWCSTKWASFPLGCSRSCCAPYRKARFSQSARAGWKRWMCGSSPAPTAISRQRRAPGVSGWTSTIDWQCSNFWCPRCANAGRTSQSSPLNLRVDTAPALAIKRLGFRQL